MTGLIQALLGISLLLAGIFGIRYGLKRLLWSKLDPVLRTATKTPLRGLWVGAIAAALFQSSTAVSLITIGFVSADYISFRNALGLILGANIGTCSTVQLMTFTVPSGLLLPTLAVCLVLAVFRPIRPAAITLAGFVGIFTGLALLSGGLSSLSDLSFFHSIVATARANPLYAIFAGVLSTFLFQSSSASTAILMTLADEGLVDLVTAAYIVYGNNIGSCLSSVVVSTVAPLAAKRVACAHIMLNILGVAVFLPFTGALTRMAGAFTPDFAAQVALLHTVFNILSSLMVMPVVRQFAYLVECIVPGKKHV